MRFLFLLFCSMAVCQAGDLTLSTSFESSDKPWIRFVPADSSSCKCVYSIGAFAVHTGKLGAALSTVRSARFAIHPQSAPCAVVPGERYRLSLWVKASSSFTADDGTPGVVVRASMFTKAPKDSPSGHIFIGIKGTSKNPNSLAGDPVPTSWTKIEAIFEIPQDTHELIPFIFIWKGRGEIFVDDFELEKVPATTPLTAAIK